MIMAIQVTGDRDRDQSGTLGLWGRRAGVWAGAYHCNVFGPTTRTRDDNAPQFSACPTRFDSQPWGPEITSHHGDSESSRRFRVITAIPSPSHRGDSESPTLIMIKGRHDGAFGLYRDATQH